jgi:hypothetical protein
MIGETVISVIVDDHWWSGEQPDGGSTLVER